MSKSQKELRKQIKTTREMLDQGEFRRRLTVDEPPKERSKRKNEKLKKSKRTKTQKKKK